MRFCRSFAVSGHVTPKCERQERRRYVNIKKLMVWFHTRPQQSKQLGGATQHLCQKTKKSRRIFYESMATHKALIIIDTFSHWRTKDQTPFCFKVTLMFPPITGVGLRNSKTSHRFGSIDCLKTATMLLLRGYSWCISVLVMIISVIWIISISTVGINEERGKTWCKKEMC